MVYHLKEFENDRLSIPKRANSDHKYWRFKTCAYTLKLKITIVEKTKLG